MSVQYRPVGWTPAKLIYDVVAVAAVAAYLLAYLRLAPLMQPDIQPIDEGTIPIRAYGSCALLLLSLVLCIGPLARLSPPFLPLLYNRRHLGVLTCLVALAHAYAVLDWYFAFSPTPPWEAMFATDTAQGFARGLPFLPFGMAALLVLLLLLAATSHDFWLAFLGPALWKGLHMAVYFAYAAAVLHLALGPLLSAASPVLAWVMLGAAGVVTALHLAAAWHGRPDVAPRTADGWVDAGPAAAIPEGGAIVVHPAEGEAVAIFRYQGMLSAVSNLCAHQGGPLGEGRVVDGCITCPWHGYQYQIGNGRAVPPYTEMLPTYRLRLAGERVALDPRALPAGTPIPPLAVEQPGEPPAEGFFIGWATTVAPDHRRLLAALALLLPAGFLGLGLLLGRTAVDPEGGAFDWAAGEQMLEGVATALPYPLLHLPSGETLLLGGAGKRGTALDPALDGRAVTATGVFIRRGTLRMFQTDEVVARDGAAVPAAVQPLGAFSIAGEICDGKCTSGAMRPGRGLAHRACANLCLTGELPPVFATALPVQGSRYLLLAGADGGPLPAAARAWTAIPVTLAGELERRGDLLVFRVKLP